MAKKTNITFSQLMAMKRPEFEAFVIDGGYSKQFAPYLSKKYPQDVYPRKKVPNEKPNAKTEFVWVADYDKQPKKVMKKITFFEAKALFAKEVLKLEPATKEKEPTFDGVIIAAANADN